MRILSMDDVYNDDWLPDVLEVVSEYGFYGAFVPYRLGSGSLDEGYYFVISAAPLPDDFDLERQMAYQRSHPYFNTKIQIMDGSFSCNVGEYTSDALWHETKSYCRITEYLSAMFARRGNGTPIPTIMSRSDAAQLISADAYAKFRPENNWQTEALFDVSKHGRAVIESYINLTRKGQNQYLVGRILNPAWVTRQFKTNPRLLWSDNPIVRAYRWMTQRNKQQVSKKVFEEYADVFPVKTIEMYGEHKSKKTGTLYKTGLYEAFVKEMKEKHPDVLFYCEKGKTIDEPTPFKNDGNDPFQGQVTYEKKYKVSFAARDIESVYSVYKRLQVLDEYTFPEHIKPIPLEELQSRGPTQVVYINATNTLSEVGLNVAIEARAYDVPFAIDDGTHYAYGALEEIPLVFLQKDLPWLDVFKDTIKSEVGKNHGKSSYAERDVPPLAETIKIELDKGFAAHQKTPCQPCEAR